MPPALPTFLLLFLYGLSILAGCGRLSAQPAHSWQVVEAGGQVRQGRQRISEGDRLDRLAGISYSTPSDFLLLYSPTGGRRLLPTTYHRPAPAGYNLVAEPTTRSVQPAYRMLVDTLRSVLGGGRFLVLGDAAALDLYFQHDLLRNLLSETEFWFAVPLGRDTTWHRLAFNASDDPATWDWELPIHRRLLFPPDGGGKGSPLQRKGSAGLVLALPSGERQWIDVFEPVFIDEEAALRREIQTIINESRHNGQSPSVLFSRIREHLQHNYGTPIENNLKLWLRQHFSLSLD